jgi:hypothetical protein
MILKNGSSNKCRPYFQKYLVEMNKDITAPNNLRERPHLDLRSIARLDPDEPLTRDEDDELCSYDVLDKFPPLPKSGMDESQLAACERMLTKSLAIVQVSSMVIASHGSIKDLVSFVIKKFIYERRLKTNRVLRVLVKLLRLCKRSRLF